MFAEDLAPAPNSCSEKEKQEACDITSTHRRARTHTELRLQLINFILTVNNGAIFPFFSLCLQGRFILDLLIMHQIWQICARRRNVLVEHLYKRPRNIRLLERKDGHVEIIKKKRKEFS